MDVEVNAYFPPHGEYTYEPCPVNMKFPVGDNAMMHCYMCPDKCRNDNFSLYRFPGFKHGGIQLGQDQVDATAWGLELLEGKEWGLLWVIGLLITVVSIVVGVTYTIVKGDIQGGFTVASFIAILSGCSYGSLLYLLDNL